MGPDGLSSSGSSSSPVLQCPAVDAAAMSAPGAGVKRGLLEALLQLSMPQEVRVLAVELTITTVDLPVLAVRAPSSCMRMQTTTTACMQYTTTEAAVHTS